MKAAACLALLAAASLTVAPVSAAKHPAPLELGTVKAAEAQAFQLGFALQMPSARAESYIIAVENLKNAKDDKEAAARTVQLAAMAGALRQAEARSYAQSVRLLSVLVAPDTLRAWAGQSAAVLSSPLVLTREAQDLAKSDPKAGAIAGTLDEAQAIKASADAQAPNLTAWLKLTRGTGAVWAREVGALTARLHVSLVSHDGAHLPSAGVRQLRDSAPAGTPKRVLNALDSLAPPRGGNLARLVPGAGNTLSPETLAAAHDTLIDAFHARPLLSGDAVPDPPAPDNGGVGDEAP